MQHLEQKVGPRLGGVPGGRHPMFVGKATCRSANPLTSLQTRGPILVARPSPGECLTAGRFCPENPFDNTSCPDSLHWRHASPKASVWHPSPWTNCRRPSRYPLPPWVGFGQHPHLVPVLPQPQVLELSSQHVAGLSKTLMPYLSRLWGPLCAIAQRRH